MSRIFLGALVTVLCCVPSGLSAELSKDLGARGTTPEANPYYRKVIESIGKPLLFEKAKILYLIAQVRLSPQGFERNGAFFKGPAAASHLLRKYGAAGRNIDTAQQFIEFLASGSSLTGKPYYILDLRGRKTLTQEFLMNELFLLDQNLRELDLRGIRYRTIHPDMDSAA